MNHLNRRNDSNNDRNNLCMYDRKDSAFFRVIWTGIIVKHLKRQRRTMDYQKNSFLAMGWTYRFWTLHSMQPSPPIYNEEDFMVK